MHLTKPLEEKLEARRKGSETAKKNYASGKRKTWIEGKHWPEEMKKRLSDAHKASGHCPKIRGGNGKVSECEGLMREILSEDWVMQFVIPTKIKGGNGYPTCYKVDFANPEKKWVLEIDGNSHISRKALDEKKDSFLNSLGWTVWRISNKRAKQLYTIWKPTGSMITSPTEF